MNVSGERLRAQLEAFHHCQVGEELIRDFINRPPPLDRHCGALNHFPSLRGENLHPDDLSGRFFRHDFDKAPCIEIDQRPGNLIQGKATALHLNPSILRFVERESHCGHLGIGKDDLRKDGHIHQRLSSQHVDGSDRSSLGCHIDQFRGGKIDRTDRRGADTRPGGRGSDSKRRNGDPRGADG